MDETPAGSTLPDRSSRERATVLWLPRGRRGARRPGGPCGFPGRALHEGFEDRAGECGSGEAYPTCPGTEGLRPSAAGPLAILGRAAPSLVRRLFLGDGGWREKRDVPSKACSAPPRPGAFHSSLLPASAHPVDERGPPRPRRLLPPPRRAAGLPSGCFGAVSVKKRSPAPQEPAIVDMICFRQRAASPIRFPLSKFPPQRSRQDPASPRFSKCGEAGRRHMTC